MRRLGAPQTVALDSADDQTIDAATQAVGHGQGGQGAVGMAQRLQQAVDHGRAQEGPGRVVNQNWRLVSAVERGQARTHRLGARGAACDRLPT
ncbi:hypothetical protein D3C80_1669120 [compost metagenome]